MSSVSSCSTSSALPRLPLPSEAKRSVMFGRPRGVRLRRTASAFATTTLTFARPALALPRRVDGHRELRDVAAFGIRDFADALLVDLVDPQYVVHGQIGLLHAGELELD